MVTPAFSQHAPSAHPGVARRRRWRAHARPTPSATPAGASSGGLQCVSGAVVRLGRKERRGHGISRPAVDDLDGEADDSPAERDRRVERDRRAAEQPPRLRPPLLEPARRR